MDAYSNHADSYLQLVTLNHSLYCQQLIEAPSHSLLSFYKAVGLILGPINAILNGVCVHIFKNPAWKKSAMSRILKGLSIVELCMGLSLFLYALLYAQNSNANDTSYDVIPMESLNVTESISNMQRSARDKAFMLTITSFLFMMLFSRCLVAFQVARNWSVVLLAAYRYDRICRPIGSGTALPRERIRLVLILIVFLSFVVVLPRVFELGIIVCDVNGLYAGDRVLLLRDRIYQIVYLGVVMFVVQSGGPIICVCVLSAFVIRLIAKRRKIHKLNEQKSARRLLSMQHVSRMRSSEAEIRSEPSSANRSPNKSLNGENQDTGKDQNNLHQTNTTVSPTNNNLPVPLALSSTVDRPSPSGDKLIFAVCITFFVLETPAFFSKILNPYLEQHHRELDLYLSVVANVLVYLDSTLNAFVYMASNPTFRKVAYEEFVKYRSRLTGASPRPVTGPGHSN